MRLWLARRRGLRRFLEAQDRPTTPNHGGGGGRAVYDQALWELGNGRKLTHWMWFVFPQGKGLGRSDTSKLYALSDWEARRYYAHPILGFRLRQCTQLVIDALDTGRTLEEIFGPVDAAKFRSCMTLFARVTPATDGLFEQALGAATANAYKDPRGGEQHGKEAARVDGDH